MIVDRGMRNVNRPVTARSASDRTDDWPIWMVWDGTHNVTAEVLDAMGVPRERGAVFLTREAAERAAAEYNVRG